MKLQTSLKRAWANLGEDFQKEAILSVLRRKTDIEVWEWMQDEKFSTGGSVFRIEQSPYLIEPMKAYRNPMVKTIVVAAPAQSGKTAYSEGCLAYGIAEVGGDSLFYGPSETDVSEFSETRMDNHYQKLPRLSRMKHPEAGKNKKNLKIHRDGSWLSLASAHTRKRLQSRTARRVHGDEPAQWPEVHIQEAMARTKFFDKTSSKHLFTSTPENMYLPTKVGEDPVPTSYYGIFISGTQKEWGVTCPDCGTWTDLGLANFVWSDLKSGEEPQSDGKWDMAQVKRNLRWLCSNAKCGAFHHDTPKTRVLFGSQGKYVAQNPEAAMIDGERYCESFHYTGFAVPWTPWFNIVRSFLNAQSQAKRGNRLQLNEVVRKELGEFWKTNDHQAKEMVITGGYSGELDKNKRVWMADAWDGMHVSPKGIPLRFLTVDVQKENFWVLVREWSKDGSSRLRAVGDVDTWNEISKLAEDLKIPPSCVFVDSGWKRYGGSSKENEVYRECFRRKWWALKGMDKDSWPTIVRRGKKRIQVLRPISEPDYRDGGQGTKLGGRTGARKFFMMFSNPTLKDHLHLLKTASTGGYDDDEEGGSVYWGVGANVPDWYIDQMESEAKSADTGRWEPTGPNHIWDTEVMQLVPAYLYGLFGGE